MKISDLIKELQFVEDLHGDIEVQLQNSPASGESIIGDEHFFIVAEPCETGMVCNIRTWPY